LHQHGPGAGQHGREEIHIQTLAPMTVPIAPRHQHHPIKGGTRRQRIEGAPHMQRMEGHAPSLEALAERWRQKEGFLPCSGARQAVVKAVHPGEGELDEGRGRSGPRGKGPRQPRGLSRPPRHKHPVPRLKFADPCRPGRLLHPRPLSKSC
jgi:hypothetical protein